MDLLVDFLQLCESSGFIELKLPYEDLKSKVTNHCTASHLTYSFRCTGIFLSSAQSAMGYHLPRSIQTNITTTLYMSPRRGDMSGQ